MLKIIKEPVLIFDKDFKIIETNPSARNLLKYNKNELSTIDAEGLFVSHGLATLKKDFSKKKVLDDYPMTLKSSVSEHIPVLVNSIRKDDLFYMILYESKENLLKSEDKFRAMAEQSLAGLFIMDSEKILFANAKMGKILGVAKEKLIGNTASFLIDFVVEEDQSLVIEQLNKKLRRDKSATPMYDLRYKMPSGKIGWVTLYSKRLSKTDAIAAMVIDITERKTYEENLQKKEKLLDSIFESFTEGIAIINLDNTIERVNAYHGDPQRLKGKDCSNIHRERNGGNCQTLACPHKEVIETGVSVKKIYHYHDKVGNLRYEQIVAYPLMDRSGDINKVIEFSKDITDSYEVLRQRELSLAVMDNSMDAIISFDMDHIITSWNKGAENMLGYSYDEVVGKDIQIITVPGTWEQTKRNIELASRKGYVRSESRRMAKDGSIIPVLKTVTLIKDLDGRVLGYSSIMKDIRAEKQANETLEKAMETVEKKVLERTRELRQSEFEKDILLKKVEDYSKKLEIKLKKIEKDKINLNEREKLVLFSITRYPKKNDEAISRLNGLNRSTVTAIRNRLKSKKWFDLLMIPDLSTLGYSIMTVFVGSFRRFDQSVVKRFKEMGNLFFFCCSDQKFVGFSCQKDIVDLNELDDILNMEGIDIFKISKPISKVSFNKFFSYSEYLNLFFNTNPKKRKPLVFAKSPVQNNHLLVLRECVKNPKATINILSKLTGLTKPTISKIRATLIDDKKMYPLVIPNMFRLNTESIFFNYFSYKDNSVDDDSLRIKVKKTEIFDMQYNNEFISLSLFPDYLKEMEYVRNLINRFEKKSLLTKQPIHTQIKLHDLKHFKLDFSGLVG